MGSGIRCGDGKRMVYVGFKGLVFRLRGFGVFKVSGSVLRGFGGFRF